MAFPTVELAGDVTDQAASPVSFKSGRGQENYPFALKVEISDNFCTKSEEAKNTPLVSELSAQIDYVPLRSNDR